MLAAGPPGSLIDFGRSNNEMKIKLVSQLYEIQAGLLVVKGNGYDQNKQASGMVTHCYTQIILTTPSLCPSFRVSLS